MGNVFSTDLARGDATADVTSESVTMSDTSASYEDAEEFHDTVDDEAARVKAKEEEMEEFRKELSVKREQRKIILARHRAEKEKLEKALDDTKRENLQLHEKNKLMRELLVQNNVEIPENLQSCNALTELSGAIAEMKEEFESLKANNNKLRRDLAESNFSLQNAYSDIADLNTQNIESMKHINALKEVITVSKTMINLREQQLIELKNKLHEIEQSLADKEANMLSADLKQEYERQLQNIRTLRGLYEERARLAEVTRQSLVRELEEQKLLTQAESAKNASLTEKVAELEATINKLEETLDNKKEVIASYQDETRGLQTEMTAVNTLFSQVLLGYKTKQDLDKLVHRLEENHGLLTHMAERENGSEASSALPKLLLEIVSQVDDIEERDRLESTIQGSREEQAVVDVDNNEMKPTEDSVSETQNPVNTSAEEIVQNLPKVWRVLTELLSHQSEAEAGTSEKMETCYKSVETKAGPVLVPSVSQTYIRLKDLILEKLALIKEVNRMKQLNGHLETRLEEQERRLSLVTTELSKTWHVVGRLRRHHHQLHTHEKILKYELQQKRKLLNELKDELEYCREKWEQAREKNSQSERDWRKLRAEFTGRKTKSTSPSFNHSGESGYSDERPSDDSSESNDESEYVTEPLKRCKKKNKRAAEPILDSSADFNLVAEREDPASDMLDVAELPLDTQDDTSGLEVSVSMSNSNQTNDNAYKNTKASDETEDEVGDIANDSCNDDSSGVEHYCNNDYCCVGTSVDIDTSNDDKAATKSSHVQSKQDLPDVPIIDAAAILKSIKEQNERLAKKDERLNNLEKNSSSLLKKSQETDKLSKQIDSTLDHLLKRPTTSKQFETAKLNNTLEAGVIPDTKNVDLSSDNIDNDEIKRSDKCGEVALSGDIETILEPDVGVTKKLHRPDTNTQTHTDTALSSMPLEFNDAVDNNDVSKVECSPTAERASDEEISCELVNEYCGSSPERQKDDEDLAITDDSSTPTRGTPEPSTSSDTNHEARFAARDLRLKRLEEQTKSLVHRVNKTTSKAVKIHYKLEELHNIYGSESSRAGTPSDDTDEKSQENEENEEEEEK